MGAVALKFYKQMDELVLDERQKFTSMISKGEAEDTDIDTVIQWRR